MGARLGLEGVVIWGEGSGRSNPLVPVTHFVDSGLNHHKSFILVRKYCFECLEQPDETAGSQGTCLRLPVVPLKGASRDHKKP